MEKIIKTRIEDIITNRWGDTYIYIPDKNKSKKYKFGGFKGKFKIKIYVPEGKKAERVIVIGE